MNPEDQIRRWVWYLLAIAVLSIMLLLIFWN